MIIFWAGFAVGAVVSALVTWQLCEDIRHYGQQQDEADARDRARRIHPSTALTNELRVEILKIYADQIDRRTEKGTGNAEAE